MLEDGRPVGPSAPVLELRARWVLRFVQKQARHEALSCDEASHYAINRAWRNLGLVLHRRAPIGYCLSRIRRPYDEAVTLSGYAILGGKGVNPYLSASPALPGLSNTT
jgi:hypothetical protein